MHQPLFRGSLREELFAILYQQHAARIFTYLRLHTHSREDAEDLLVDVFLACLESPAFPGLSEAQKRAWLWQVVHHKLVDFFRRRVVRQRVVNVDDFVAEVYYDEDLSPERLAERSEDYLRLYKLVRGLAPSQQQVLRLRLVEGLRSKEIAARLGKSEGAVRTIFSRTLNLLRSAYQQEEGIEE